METNESNVHDFICKTHTVILDDINKNYDNARNFRMVYDYVPTHNLAQGEFNNYFSRFHDVDGTCTITASTIATKFYLENGDNPLYYDNNDIYNVSLVYAEAKEYYKNGQGTTAGKAEEIFSYSLRYYDINNTTWLNKNNIYQGVKAFTYSPNAGSLGKVQIFGVKGHEMVANGYFECSFEYTEHHRFLWWTWTSEEQKTLEYLIVCNGWDNGFANRGASIEEIDIAYDYFPMDTIEEYVVGVDLPERNWLYRE